MRKIHPVALAATALLATTLAACGTTESSAGSEAASGEPITLTDARGEEITLDGPAARVATTEWNTTEYLISLGIQPVGVSDITGFGNWDTAVELSDDATDIGTRGEPSLDTLATLDLDAVLVTDELPGDAIEQIEKIAPVIQMDGGQSGDQINHMFENLDLVAQATGTEDRATRLREEFDAAMSSTKDAVDASDLASSPIALSDAYDTGEAISIRPFMADSQLGTILADLGFEDAWSSIDGLEPDPAYGLAQTDVEGLTQLPDDTLFWYIANDVESDLYRTTLADNAVWTGLPFVAAGDTERLPDVWMFGGPESMMQFLDAIVDLAG